jgi:histidyl-tRNA synthetase
MRWIDRRGKMSPEDWIAYGKEVRLSDFQLGRLKELLSDDELWQKSEELVRFFAAVDVMGFKNYVRFDPNIVRGLDYYTGIVFEAADIKGDVRRSILGGGRYDNLLADVGGERLPSVGFAMGDMVVALLLEEYGRIPQELDKPPASVLVTIFNESSLLASFALAAELRRAGLKVNCYPEAAKLSKQFKFADRTGIRLAVLLGPDELASNQVGIKNLRSGEQCSVPRPEAAKTLRKMLDQPESP